MKKIIFISMVIGIQIIISRSFAEIFLIDLMAILSVIYLLLNLIKRKNIIILPSRFNFIYSLFIICIFIINIILNNGIKGTIKWVEFYIVIWGIFIITKKYFNEMEITKIILYSNYLCIILSFIQYFIGNYNQAKFYAMMSPVQIVIASIYFFHRNKFFNSFCIVISILLSVLIKSRGNLLGITIFLIFIAIEYLVNVVLTKKIKLKNIVILNLVAIIIPLSMIIYPKIYQPVFDILKTIDSNKYETASNNERTMMIEKSVDIIKKYPITGIGEGNASYYFIGKESNLTVHNTFLQIGLENGIIAMFLYIIIISQTMIMIFNIRNKNIYYRYINIVNLIILYELMLSPFSGNLRVRTAIILAYILELYSRNKSIEYRLVKIKGA